VVGFDIERSVSSFQHEGVIMQLINLLLTCIKICSRVHCRLVLLRRDGRRHLGYERALHRPHQRVVSVRLRSVHCVSGINRSEDQFILFQSVLLGDLLTRVHLNWREIAPVADAHIGISVPLHYR
jgi:hypothetical protein